MISLIVVLLLTAAAVAYVSYPLLRAGGDRRPTLLAVAPETVVVAGVAYESEEEWAVDRALDKADDGKPEATPERSAADLALEIERQVADLRARRKAEQAPGKRMACTNCGKPFQAGDRFCARCGVPHPSICPQCGERHRPGDCFCTACGAALPGGEE